MDNKKSKNTSAVVMQLNPVGYWIYSKYLKMTNDPSFIASSLLEDIDDLSLSAIY